MLQEVARVVVGLVLLAWLPGHAWRRVLLPRLEGLARPVVDVVLSVALVTLGVFLAAGLFGAVVSVPTAVWIALTIAAAGFAPTAARALSRRMPTLD